MYAPAHGTSAAGDSVLRAVLAEASATAGGAVTMLLRFAAGTGAGMGAEAEVATVVAASAGEGWVGARVAVDPAAAVVVVDGRRWGALATVTDDGAAAGDPHGHLTRFAEMAGAAIAGAHAREELRVMADEQSALRRVAELVAHGAADEELFDAVAVEASRLIDEGATLVRFDGPRSFTILATCGGPAPVGLSVEVPEDSDGTVAEVLRTRRPARRDEYQIVVGPQFGRADFATGSSVSVPILVEDRLWGLLGSLTERRRLPAGTEERLQKFAELVAAAIANSHARAQVQRLADEQAALRRVAELVAHGAGEEELFDTVTREAAALVGQEATTLVRYEGDRTFTILATFDGPAPPGTRIFIPPEDGGAMAQMLRHPDRPVRLDDYGDVAGPTFSTERYGVRSSVSVPIRVDGRLWGMLGVLTKGRRLPRDTEERLHKFADLVAAALANNHARWELARLAREQAALRRVAELVARSAPLAEIFDATATEASRLVAGLPTALTRFDEAGRGTVVATCRSDVPVGLELSVDGETVAAGVFRTGCAVRLSTYAGTGVADVARRYGVAAAVGVPIVVDGRIRAVLATSSADGELPSDAEARLEQLAGLAAAGIANAENKANLTDSRARVIATADEARRRLQRDVHDGAQQRLVQTVIALEMAQDALARGGSATAAVDEALAHAQRANAELRDIVHGILPGALSRGGLRAGIESLIMDLPTPVRLEFSAPRLGARTETTAYFIVAEALTNVVKHARATGTEVRVRLTDGELVVVVADDGVGGADSAGGTGLTGLRDRVEAAEGVLTITSSHGAGTTLEARLPVPRP